MTNGLPHGHGVKEQVGVTSKNTGPCLQRHMAHTGLKDSVPCFASKEIATETEASPATVTHQNMSKKVGLQRHVCIATSNDGKHSADVQMRRGRSAVAVVHLVCTSSLLHIRCNGAVVNEDLVGAH